MRNNIDMKSAAPLANKYFDNASVMDNHFCTRDEFFLDALGTNELTSFFYDCIDQSLSIRIMTYLKVNIPIIVILLKMELFKFTLNVIQFIVTMFAKYVDLPKDLLLLYIIWIQLVNTDSGLFSLSIFWTLASSNYLS